MCVEINVGLLLSYGPLLSILLLVGFSKVLAVGEEFISTDHIDHDPLENDDLFEGDLKISPEMIGQYYGIPGGGVSKRAATNSAMKLWPNGTVPYRIDPDLPSDVKRNISRAISHWSRNTCLHFHLYTMFWQVYSNITDYVYFTNESLGCYSTSVGKEGGQQIINLGSVLCGQIGVILHEIGHAIGFWHEQSRPDRDQYVKILWSNMFLWFLSQFRKRHKTETDSRGVGYDYGSIMHYRLNAFSKNNQSTIAINNDMEYTAQGRPVVGQRNGLSSRDILQAKCMYGCIGAGTLNVFLDYCGHRAYTRNATEVLHLVVIIEAADCTGESNKTTVIRRHRPNSSWSQSLTFGLKRWHSLRITASNGNGTLANGNGTLANGNGTLANGNGTLGEEVAVTLDSVKAPFTSSYLIHPGGSRHGILKYRFQLAQDSSPLIFNSWCHPLLGTAVIKPNDNFDETKLS